MPDGSVYVGRPSKWGNPFAIGEPFEAVEEEGGQKVGTYVCRTAEQAVEHFTGWTDQDSTVDLREDVRRELRGKDLACWCRLDQPCHADVLLKIANG